MREISASQGEIFVQKAEEGFFVSANFSALRFKNLFPPFLLAQIATKIISVVTISYVLVLKCMPFSHLKRRKRVSSLNSHTNKIPVSLQCNLRKLMALLIDLYDKYFIPISKAMSKQTLY